ncbi:reverse transcriptase domain-containing protein [Tanacetum coccineum]
MKKLSKKDQLMLDEELAFKLQAEEEEEDGFKKSKRKEEHTTNSSSMEDEFKPNVQPQRQVNPNIKEVVPKKRGMIAVKNEKNKLIPQRTVTGWREKTTFTCPYGTFAYKQMPFRLCNAPATFQRCMIAIFHELIVDSMEVFMDDFSIFGNSFDQFLKKLEKMLKRCEETNLVLNWEKCHFMVKEGIVLSHKVLVEEEKDYKKVQAVSFYPRTEPVEPLEWKAPENQLKPLSIEPPKLELKELPKHLEYTFLQENNQLLVVISSALSTIKKARLLEFLKYHKGAIA